MWKNVASTIVSTLKTQKFLLPNELLYQPARTTFILKRKFPTQLHKKGKPQKTLRSRHYVYELVQDTSAERQPNVDVILTTFVEGLGNVGDKVSVKPNKAYNQLLLPGLAVYASPENEKKYMDAIDDKNVTRYSTPTAAYTVKTLSRMLLSVVMNKETPWTLQPWHVKASFRKCGYNVPEEAITLPEKPISGPNLDLESKEFFVTVTINKQEKVNVRCRLHHWSTEVAARLPHVHNFWEIPAEPILPEQAPILEALPKKPPIKVKIEKKKFK